ncbi:MAG: aminodeoxychorismate synthase component I [Gammaproteobacteria bacterium]|nr:aminodeoxychorismate synthase component I [Gammaproteobacteria bacterium]
MKTLLIDNYDSFTFNLYQLIAEVNRVPPVVVRNDTAPWSEIRQLDFDNIVISPGPGRPERPQDFGICAEAIRECPVPVLGVCLGHQGIGHLYGGKVDYAARVMHGRPSLIHHTGQDIFKGIPSPFTAIRYHSLHVAELSDELDKLAWTEDGMLMGLRHKTRRIWGVQFHPESICSEYGHQILENFRALTAEFLKQNPPRRRVTDTGTAKRCPDSFDIVPHGNSADRDPVSLGQGEINGRPFRIFHRRVPMHLNAEQVFMNFFANSTPNFWLDSALVRGFSRFSYMGDASGPHAEYVSYSLPERKVTVTRRGQDEVFNESIFTYLDRMLHERHAVVEGLPFDFNLGYAGYLGYELKADCGATAAHRASTPDAAFVFADRIIAFDHEENIAYLVCLDDEDHADRARQWLNDMQAKLQKLPAVRPWRRAPVPRMVMQTARHSPEKYLQRIRECQQEIKHGESYEICLTNMITQHVTIDPMNTYRALRESNPAPYATYLNFPGVAVLSSSPERFLTIGPNGTVESKPIKGTRPRGKTPEEDERIYQDLRENGKDRSENLMIVDLLRNDLGTVSDVGSVYVSNIFSVESYATVHQLVSTVHGRLRRGISSVQCVQAAFPGGSMTGAPKKRSMEIIDRLEGGPRGIYSGSIGFFGLNGSADLSIVIRTIVVTPEDVTVGVGGAIIDLSDPQEELEEMLLKSRALVHALAVSALDGEPSQAAL